MPNIPRITHKASRRQKTRDRNLERPGNGRPYESLFSSLSPYYLYSSPSANHYVLLLVVKGYPLAGMERRNGHAKRHGVVICGMDVGVRRLARSDAFHPVPHMSGG